MRSPVEACRNSRAAIALTARLGTLSIGVLAGPLVVVIPGPTTAAVSPSAVAPAGSEAARTTGPSDAQVAAALGQLNEDPNLGARKKTRTLRWKSSEEPDTPEHNNWLEWITGAFTWLATTARALLWVAGIITVGIVGLYIKRFLELRAGERARPLQITVPTHVRDLDIRPDSLPEEIGASALESWERGEHRAALSLLYRGMLSRLAHVHSVPIRDSSTEGDCLRLALAHLQPAPAAYVAQLIRVWQRSVYGSIDPTAEGMRSLCAQFDAAIGKPSPVVGQAA